MADTDAKALLLQVDASIELAQRNLRALAADVDRKSKDMQASLTRIDKAAANMGQGFTVAKAAVAGFVGGITAGIVQQLPSALAAAGRNALDMASSIGEAADSLGVSAEFLQRFRFAATQTGASVEQADGALGKFQRTVGGVLNGSKDAVDAFKRLGLSQADVARYANDLPALFQIVADRIAKVPDPARQAADAIAIFGRGATPLLTLLRQGADGFSALAAEADRLGVVLDRDLLNRADEFADKMGGIKMIVNAQMARAITDNADALVYLAKAAAGAVGFLGDIGKQLQGTAAIYRSEGLTGVLGSSAERLRMAASASGRTGQIDEELRGLGGGRGAANRRAALLAERRSLEAGRAQELRALVFKDVFAPRPAGGGSDFTPVKAGTAKDPLAKFYSDFERMRDDTAAAYDKTFQGRWDNYGPGVGSSAKLDAELADIDKRKQAELDAVSAVAEARDRAYQAQKTFTEDLTRNLGQAIVYGQNIGEALVNSFKAAAAEAIASGLFKILLGAGGGGGLIGGLFSSFGGFFANGGNLGAGKWGIAGEAGPEIVRGPAQIVPITGGGFGGGLVVNVDARGATDPAMIEAAARRGAAAGMAQAGDTLRRATRPKLRGGRG